MFFRILGGSLMTITMTGELLTDFRLYYVQHSFHFSYLFFQWLGAWPPAIMYLNLVANIGRGFRPPNVFDLGTLGPRPGNRQKFELE